jgi:predicted nucleotidyltransferase
MFDPHAWRPLVAALDVQPLFVTVSGAHLYGFESPDSDVDLRGCHLLPLRDVVGLHKPNQTLEQSGVYDGIEVDLVSHDAGKYFGLLVRNNGYVLEQIFSPLVVTGQEFLDRLRPIAARCITRHHYYHYRGFIGTQRKLLQKEEPKRAKTLLYAYRVLLTGIHLLGTGEVEANLRTLNERFRLPYIDELIASKTGERVAMPQLDWSFHDAELRRLEQQLDQAYAASPLGEERDIEAVNELLIELRLGARG